MDRFRRLKAALCALFLLGSSAAQFSAYAAALNEYQIKAGFLFQFTKFIEWPSGAETGDTFNICVVGKDPFGEILDEIRGEKIKNREVEIKHTGPHGLDGCQLIFISKSEEDRFDKILNSVKGKSILTVSESPEFLGRGGMINFLMSGNKIRFEINDKDAKASGLKISSKLLSIASRVKS